MFNQKDNYSCGVAAIRNALLHFGEYVSDRKVRHIAGTSYKEGTSEIGVSQALVALGYVPVAQSFSSFKEGHSYLSSTLEEGHPCLLCVDQDRHWLNAIGIVGDRTVIFDPDNNRNNRSHSGVHIMTKRALSQRWKGASKTFYLIAVYPKKK